MSDFEILDKYIKEFHLDNDFEKLSYLEKTLYKCHLRDTLSFRLYLTRYRILEFANKIVERMKGEQNEGDSQRDY